MNARTGTLKNLVGLSPQEALSRLGCTQEGLTTREVEERQARYGFNEVVRKPYRLVIREAIAHSINPLVIILLLAALVSAFTGTMTNAIIIIVILTLSIGLDYFQSHRSLTMMRTLQNQIASTSCVLRNGQWHEVFCRELVPGDIIRLAAGDMVPADVLLLTTKELYVQQAALTGESLPIEKEAILDALVPDNPVDAKNALFSGSSVVNGTATALVAMTGGNSQFGHIVEELTKISPHTEFEKGINRFGLFIMKVVFFFVIFIFAVNIYLKRSLLDSLLFSVALAVGLTPELLPMITTVTLAAGAVRMAKKKVIVKNLSAIQNFGSIDILCSDKTGTLTTGTMVLEKHVDPFGKSSDQVMLLAFLNSAFLTEIKNPYAATVLKKTTVNPMDAAVLKHEHPKAQAYSKVDEIPFDFERRRSSVVVENSGDHRLITKGAPEFVLQVCTHYDADNFCYELNDSVRKTIDSVFRSFSQQGYRVLAMAYKKMVIANEYHPADETGMIFAGFLAFMDPPLAEVPSVIKQLKQAGVHVKILTGDNEEVTRQVCNQSGINIHKIVIGSEMDHITDSALGPLVEQMDVFARITPIQKQRIINALRARGHVVGYIGDGINDVPSLHNADVGISVSGAVDVAREAADIILLKRHLNVLLDGIIEGRKSFANVMKYLMMGTSSNFGNMLSMAIIAPFLSFFPMKPRQILLNNLLYDLSQVPIPTDHVDASFMHKPKHWNIDIIKRFMFYIGPISSLFDFITFFVMLHFFHASESLFQTGWFIESLATQILVIFIIRTIKNPFKSRPSRPLLITVLLTLTIGIIVPFSPFAKTLGFVPLPGTFFIFLIVATGIYLVLVEAIKRKLMWQWFQKNN